MKKAFDKFVKIRRMHITPSDGEFLKKIKTNCVGTFKVRRSTKIERK